MSISHIETWRNEEILPSELPEAAMPTTVAILVVKYVDKIATLGMNSAPDPIPMQNACAKRTCQYSWHRLSIIWPRTSRRVPLISSARK